MNGLGLFDTSPRKRPTAQGAETPYGHRAFTADEIRKRCRWPHDRVEEARKQVEMMHARLSGAQYRHANPGRPGYRDASEAEIEHWRGEVSTANAVYATLDREAQPPPPLHTCARPVIVDNTAEHDRLYNEHRNARAAVHSFLSTIQLPATGGHAPGALVQRERAAADALKELRLVRQVRLYNAWTVTIWIVDPSQPHGYDVSAVHDASIADPREIRAWYTLQDAARQAGELCRYILD
jgi:hypothetical protein